jgi:hypothetical protein
MEEKNRVTVGELIRRLEKMPQDARVEIEVHDHPGPVRLFGPLWLVMKEGDEVNLFARHYRDLLTGTE